MYQRIALLIDGADLGSTAAQLGFEIDYRRLLQAFRKLGTVTRSYFYIAVNESGEVDRVRPFIDWLNYNGFTVREKFLKQFQDRHGRLNSARSLGVELAVDALELARQVDQIILFTSDGDLAPVAKAVQRRGARVAVVSSVRTSAPVLADELRRRADEFLELDRLRRSIERVRTS